MKDAAEDAAPGGDWHSILRAQRFGNDVARSRQPAPDPRDDEPAHQPNESAEKEGVRLAMDRIIALQQMIARLDVDDYLRDRVRRDRELGRGDGLDEQAGTEMKRSCRHCAPANLSGCRRMTRGAISRAAWSQPAMRRSLRDRLDHHSRNNDRQKNQIDELRVPESPRCSNHCHVITGAARRELQDRSGALAKDEAADEAVNEDAGVAKPDPERAEADVAHPNHRQASEQNQTSRGTDDPLAIGHRLLHQRGEESAIPFLRDPPGGYREAGDSADPDDHRKHLYVLQNVVPVQHSDSAS